MNEANRSHFLNAIKQNTRADGRKNDEYREIKVETDVIANAEGSARVTIGDTVVLAGVKVALETPYPDTPDQGNFMVNVELLPLSNPDFEVGPPSIDAIELARVTDRGIRESKAIDTKKLCIKKGEKVWGIVVDICPVNDAGNLFDASALAALSAIKDAKFPKTTEEDDVLLIDYKEKTKESIPLVKKPISVTVWKLGDNFIVDPTLDEQKLYDARLSVCVAEDGNLCALQKGGEDPFTLEQVEKMIDLALKKAKDLAKLV